MQSTITNWAPHASKNTAMSINLQEIQGPTIEFPIHQQDINVEAETVQQKDE